MSNPYLVSGRAASGGTAGNPYLNAGRASGGGSVPKKKGGGGWLHTVSKYSGADLAGHLVKDVGETAFGVVPGAIAVGKAAGHDLGQNVRGHGTGVKQGGGDIGKKIVKPIVRQYKDYYGHDVLHHLYEHPLQPILDAAAVASLGAGGAAKAGLISGDRATIITRSPRKIVTDKGPSHVDITSTAPLVRGREKIAAKIRVKHPEGLPLRPGGTPRIGGEVKKYGKQIQQQAGQKALGRMIAHEPYVKATKGLSPAEWSALHIRAMDIHPDELKTLWKGTPLESTASDPKVVRLALTPSKKMLRAEPEMKALSEQGAGLYKQTGRLKEETAARRPDLTKRQASEVLGHPVKGITGKPYYFPHTLEPQRNVSPLASTGGGRGVPKELGSTKQNTGALALHGKMHLRSDVLGPEFLKRVKVVKYEEIHNALVRGAPRVTRDHIEHAWGGKLPKGYGYLRKKASDRIPPTIRGEGETRIPIDQLVPNIEDLSGSPLGEGFTTTDPAQAYVSGGRYYIVPNSMAKAATGEFTRSSDFTRHFVKQPLQVWRAVVLGLRVGFLTNNLVGNSVMYAVKTGGQGAIRDLFMAIKESHGPKVAKQALDSTATPPKIRADLYREFFPEQVRGTFGRTQTPATSPGHIAGRKSLEIGRAATGAIPKLTAKVAEEYPRRALVRHYIRHSPEFKRVYQTLPRQTRTFEQAARQVLEGKGGAAYQRYVSKRVNQALGDYLGLSPAERNVIRNTIPFYSWYKAITVTTAHLAVDTPLRANILGQIGRIGKEQSDHALGEVPSFLRGSIPLGEGKGGTKKVLSTQGLNPYATLEQLRRAAAGDYSSLGLNPFIEAPLQAIERGQKSPAGIARAGLTDIVRGLPPMRLAKPMPPSKLYPNRNRKSELYSFLGAPVKEYNPTVAAQQKRQGR